MYVHWSLPYMCISESCKECHISIQVHPSATPGTRSPLGTSLPTGTSLMSGRGGASAIGCWRTRPQNVSYNKKIEEVRRIVMKLVHQCKSNHVHI